MESATQKTGMLKEKKNIGGKEKKNDLEGKKNDEAKNMDSPIDGDKSVCV